MNTASQTSDTMTLLKLVVQALVSDVDEVVVTPYEGENGKTLLQVQVAARDLGKVIGRDGRIARSIRTVFLGIARQQGGNYQIDFPATGDAISK